MVGKFDDPDLERVRKRLNGIALEWRRKFGMPYNFLDDLVSEAWVAYLEYPKNADQDMVMRRVRTDVRDFAIKELFGRSPHNRDIRNLSRIDYVRADRVILKTTADVEFYVLLNEVYERLYYEDKQRPVSSRNPRRTNHLVAFGYHCGNQHSNLKKKDVKGLKRKQKHMREFLKKEMGLTAAAL